MQLFTRGPEKAPSQYFKYDSSRNVGYFEQIKVDESIQIPENLKLAMYIYKKMFGFLTVPVLFSKVRICYLRATPPPPLQKNRLQTFQFLCIDTYKFIIFILSNKRCKLIYR